MNSFQSRKPHWLTVTVSPAQARKLRPREAGQLAHHHTGDSCRSPRAPAGGSGHRGPHSTLNSAPRQGRLHSWARVQPSARLGAAALQASGGRQQVVHAHELSNMTPGNLSQGNDRTMALEHILCNKHFYSTYPVPGTALTTSNTTHSRIIMVMCP